MGPRKEMLKMLKMLEELAEEFDIRNNASAENAENVENVESDEAEESNSSASIRLGLVGDVKDDLVELFEDFPRLYESGVIADDDLVWVITSDLLQIGIIPSEVGKVNYLVNLDGEIIGDCKRVKEMVVMFGKNVTELIRTAENIEELTEAISDEFKELYDAIEFMVDVIIPLKKAEKAQKEDKIAIANAKLKRIQKHLDELEKEENDNQED